MPPYYIEVHTVTGIGNNEMVTSFYPNPTKKKLNIVFKQAISNGEINIINSGGQTVYNGNFSGIDTEVNVRDFRCGNSISYRLEMPMSRENSITLPLLKRIRIFYSE
jgi:hypothetical protein